MIAMQNAVTRAQRGLATSVSIFSRNIGSAIGVSLQGAVLVGVLMARLRIGSVRITNPQAALDSTFQAGLTPAGHEAFRLALAQALHGTFLLGLALVLGGLVLVLVYMPSGGVLELSPVRAAGGGEAD